MDLSRRTLLSVGVAAGTACLILWPLEVSLAPVATVRSRLQLLPGDVGWLLDALRNIVAFVPLGAALGRRGALRVAAAGAALSAGVELVQIFQLDRFVSLTDVAFNTLGCLAGRGLATVVPPALRGLARQELRVRFGATVCCAALAAAGVWTVDRGMRPGGWQQNYVLAMNSSALGQVPWCGTLDTLEIVVGGERWTGDGLSWRRDAMAGGPCAGAPWWMAAAPASLARAVQTGRRVSIRLTATPTLDQIGPARVLTWADTRDGRRRNVLIAQESDTLVVYVRRGLGGEEGRRPYYLLPDVFRPGTPASVTLDIDREETIIRTETQTVTHRYDPAQDWAYLLRGRSRYQPPTTFRAVLFWTVISAPVAAAAGVAAGPAAAAGALAWIGGSVLALLACSAMLTGSPLLAPALSWGFVTGMALLIRGLMARRPTGPAGEGPGFHPSPGHHSLRNT